MEVEESLAAKWAALFPYLDERQRRLLMGLRLGCWVMAGLRGGPGTAKWNEIEHWLFSQISMNWRGQPLVSR